MALPRLPEKDLELVSNNFQNIYLAAHLEGASIELVPALFGNRLYVPTAGWQGRILRYFYRCISFLGGPNFLQNKLLKAILATQESFQTLQTFRSKFIDESYQEHLYACFDHKKDKVSITQVQNARKQIQLFYEATHPLVCMVRKRTHDNLNQFLAQYFENITPFCEEKQSFQRLKDFINIISLEGTLSGNIPLHLFQKIYGVSPEKIPENKLEKFVKKITKARKQGRFEIAAFHQAIKSIISCLERKLKASLDIKKLETTLIKEGCVFINDLDDKHLQWRAQLKKGSQFTFDKRLLGKQGLLLCELGESLKGREKSTNHYEVFEIFEPYSNKKYNNYLFISGPNRNCFTYSQFLRNSKTYWGLEPPKYCYIDPKGRYAIVEKISQSLDTIEWKSNTSNTNELDDTNKPFADALRKLIQFFVDENSLPQDFDIQYFKFDKEKKLRSVKDGICSETFDAIALEEMIYTISRGNLQVYQHLVDPLRRSDTKQTKNEMNFFEESIKILFDNYRTPLESLARSKGIADERTISRAQTLQKKATAFKESCYQKIKQAYAHEGIDEEKLLKTIRKNLIILYQNSKTFGRFWDDDSIETSLYEAVKKSTDDYL